ncbi:ChrR family anti-sigma-E factor [Vibrio sp. AK197]
MRFHPDKLLLQQYAQGDVDATQGLALAVHLESCPECHQQVVRFERQLGAKLEHQAMEPSDDLPSEDMLSQILTLPQKSREELLVPSKPHQVTVNSRRFTLPKALYPFRDRIGDWRNYGGKVFSAVIDLEEEARVNLMYMAPGVSVPQHTHKGYESTLVLHGGFSDEDGHYRAGDFLLKDASVKHSPTTSQDEDCLCLSVLTEPMLFTQGVARIFNMFGKGLYP